MPSAAKKLVIVHNNEPSRPPSTRRSARGRRNCGCSKRCCLPPAQPLDEATLAQRLARRRRRQATRWRG